MSTGFPYRRHIGRAASPPLFQIYDLPITQPLSRSPSPSDESDSDESDCSSSSSSSKHSSSSAPAAPEAGEPSTVAHDTDDHCKVTEDADTEKELAEKARLEEEIEEKRRRREKRKGKQRDDGTTLDRKARRRQRDDPDTVYSYRPILTIRSSQGFVWNQDLFVPSYMKDRYQTSFSPSTSASGSVPSSFNNSTSFSGMDFEVECVEIRVREDEDSPLAGMIPA